MVGAYDFPLRQYGEILIVQVTLARSLAFLNSPADFLIELKCRHDHMRTITGIETVVSNTTTDVVAKFSGCSFVQAKTMILHSASYARPTGGLLLGCSAHKRSPQVMGFRTSQSSGRTIRDAENLLGATSC